MMGRGASLLTAGAVTLAAASRPRLEAGPLYLGVAGSGGGGGMAAGAVVVTGAGASESGDIMKGISRSLAPAVRKATRPSIEVSNLVLDCLILVMMMSSEILAWRRRMTSRLVMAAGAAVLGADGAAFFCGGGGWPVEVVV